MKVPMPKGSDAKLAVVWIEDIDHPISSPGRPGDPNWTKYDPRNVEFQHGQLVFDAVPGDHISFVIGFRTAQ